MYILATSSSRCRKCGPRALGADWNAGRCRTHGRLAGPPDPDPIAGLVSDTMRQFLVEAAEHFDWVVVDSPPVASLPDANLLVSMIDTTLLVVNAGTTPHSFVSRAVEAIGRSRILGVVLNRADQADETGDEYSYSYGRSKRVSSRSWFRFGSARKD